MEDYQTLHNELANQKQRIVDLEMLETLHLRALEELHLHQEELRSQNEELRQTQSSLTEISRRFRELFDYAPVANFLLDRSGAIVESNLAGCELLQESRASLMRRPLVLYLGRPCRDHFSRLLATTVSGKLLTAELQIQGRKGMVTPVQMSLVAEEVNAQPHYRLAAIDISARKQAEEQRQLAATVFEESSECIMITDARGRIQRVNRAFTVVTGYLEAEVIGKRSSFLSSGRHGKNFYIAMWAQLSREGHWQGEIWNRRKNGEEYPEWLKINTVYDEGKKVRGRVSIFKDIGEMRRDSNQCEHLAFYDLLTELPNRTLFIERLKHALIHAQRDQKQVALLYLDLDRFKQVNDTLGHQTGDILLQDVASRLRQLVRSDDTVARLGGDEFTVILSELGGLENAQDIAHRVASNICKQLCQAFQIGPHEIVVGSSVGIAYYPIHGKTYTELVRNADLAMYRAKAQGGGRFVTFSEDMNEQLRYRVVLEGALRHALRRNELQLSYQPVVNAATGDMVGVEVLSRWFGPKGPVSPLEFIPILEDLGMGNELARWVLNKACEELKALSFWDKGFWFSINISPQVLIRNHIDWISEIVAQSGVPAQRLVIEVTEDHLRHNPEIAIKAMHEIRQLGVRVALDDFGTGYSSLGRLRDFPIDMIKIDRSFINALNEHPKDMAIIVTIITLARELGLEILAEGVETQSQLRQLLTKGCDIIQGYVFAKPMPIENYAEWFALLDAKLPLFCHCHSQRPI